ncbi:MAG: hypothetical protein C0467_18625 [Planctomycetaceae bacterium]|nr:hypothetical protein [Planctomycetaceae bacterium]
MVESQPEAPQPLQPAIDPVNFRVNEDDLLILARHWMGVIHDYQQFLFYYQQSWSSGRRRADHAYDQLDRIAEVIGGDAMKKAWGEVNSELRQRMGEDVWQIYKYGDAEARKRYSDETYGALLSGEVEGQFAESWGDGGDDPPPSESQPALD